MKSSELLLGAELFIYTDQKYVTFANLNSCYILCQCSFVEEHGPAILDHSGKNNVIANSLSHLPCHDVLPIPVRESTPVVHFDFTSNSLNFSNDHGLI